MLLPAIRSAIEKLCWQACGAEKGTNIPEWKWDGFWLSDWEWKDVNEQCLRAFIAGVQSNSAGPHYK